MHVIKVVLPFLLVLTVFWDLNLGSVFITFPLVLVLLFGNNLVRPSFLVMSATLVGLIYDAWIVGRLGILGTVFFLGAFATLVIFRSLEGVAFREILAYLLWYAVFAVVLREIWGIVSIGALALLRWRLWARG